MGYVGNEPSVNFTSFAKQDLTGVTGSPVKRGFTLTYAVANANEIEVFVNNVRQEPTEAYTVSGTALTMTGDVETTDDFYIIYLGKAIQTTTPPDGSVTSAKISYPLTTFSSTGIDDNATSTAITIDASQNVDVAGELQVGVDGTTAGLIRLMDSGSVTEEATISSDANGGLIFGGNSGAGELIFRTGSSTERMRIGSDGETTLTANASGAYAFKVINDGNASNRFGIVIQTGEDTPTTTNYLMGFKDGNGNSVGSITFNNTGQTSFNQSSDYRLKENVTEDWNATTRLKELKPCRFNFKKFPNTTLDGFIAHEAQEVVPEAVIGEKDAVDDDGNPIYQGIDQSKLVPLLVKTIQELEARITALENS